MPPNTTNPGAGGANPAPLYKEKTNAIAALMSRHTSSSLSFLSSLPSRNTGSFTALKKTPAQLAAEREDYELDRLVQYDDNMGVGMFAPENRKEKEEKRQRELEDRKLKARLGLKSKRKGSEWEGASGVARAREQESDDEELGRSAVGRAKKRMRITSPPDVDTDKPAADHQHENTHADVAPHKDGEGRGDEIDKAGQAADETAGAGPGAEVDVNDNSNTEARTKSIRKKRKKNKPLAQGANRDGG
ncbi:hypothetical protein BKA67DRAFT_655925 [Truncatella angustata]|uniref:Uncharacterized protein n=1 Tax=Truncatella angustata TaxID=152316 RepID=A0A9P8UTE2_9PEZI|nr:uncharacterized protein BKA67DRAFT_655925 [Truncatella angustata]KAH6657675.1 hypothetical protein BKA67DRAFT_655925 [Truncatella angustata]KAH8197271.1 hypothetical protein TruAng_008554 [Truncatella angustata]